MLPKEYCCPSLILTARQIQYILYNILLLFFNSRCQAYFDSQWQAYSLKMSVILLRVRGGLDFSAHIVDEELVEPEVMKM